MAMPVSRPTSHLIQEIVLISAGVVSKCDRRMVGELFKKDFAEQQKKSCHSPRFFLVACSEL
jgi:hypothetical protein